MAGDRFTKKLDHIDAAVRVKAYLDAQATLGGVDHENLHVVHVGNGTYRLLASDLRTLVNKVLHPEDD